MLLDGLSDEYTVERVMMVERQGCHAFSVRVAQGEFLKASCRDFPRRGVKPAERPLDADLDARHRALTKTARSGFRMTGVATLFGHGEHPGKKMRVEQTNRARCLFHKEFTLT